MYYPSDIPALDDKETLRRFLREEFQRVAEAFDEKGGLERFTPRVIGTSSEGVGTYSVQQGSYRRVNGICCFSCQLTWSAHTGTGNLRIGDLPFYLHPDSVAQMVSIQTSDIALTAGDYALAAVIPDTNQVTVNEAPTGGGTAIVVPMDTAGTIFLAGCYNIK